MRRAWALAAPLLALPLVAPLAASQFDGKYAGQRTLVRGAAPPCAAEGPVTWTVDQGHVSIKYGNVPLAADVGGDGSFRVTAQYQATQRNFATALLQGRIAGPALEADLETHACKIHYSLKKQ